MPRPTVIRNEVILDAARSIFLERGLDATSAEVAQRAGVSEGSIFKRFKTKADLFRAAMGVDVNDMPKLLEALPTLAGTATVHENLVEVGVQTVQLFERTMPILMMSWSSLRGNPCLSGEFATSDPPPIRAHRHLAEYFTREMALGRIGPIDPQVVARAFLGALSHHVFVEMMVGHRGGNIMERDGFVRSFVTTLLQGMSPQRRNVATSFQANAVDAA